MSRQCAWNEKAQFGVKICTCKGIGYHCLHKRETHNETCSIKTHEQMSHPKHVTVVADGTGRGDGVGDRAKREHVVKNRGSSHGSV